MKKLLLSLVLICSLGAGTALAQDQSPGCIPDLYGQWICPPPNGGMMTDINGNIVCGPGLCGRDSRGKVRCSALPGGLAVIDSRGAVICVGGCVDGSTKACMKPTP